MFATVTIQAQPLREGHPTRQEFMDWLSNYLLAPGVQLEVTDGAGAVLGYVMINAVHQATQQIEE